MKYLNSFQSTIFSNGTIVFVYISIPEMLTSEALYDHEPAAGLSDAFLVGDSELHVYHTVNVAPPDIIDKTVAVFHPKPTCIAQRSCEACAKLRDESEFACSWCPSAHRCSDGADRLREKWDQMQCGAENVTQADLCGVVNDNHMEWRSANNNKSPIITKDNDDVVVSQSTGGSNVAVIISVVISLVLILILIGLVLGFVYLFGKNNPGGFAESLALRLERNYKRFGGENDDDQRTTSVELGRTRLNNETGQDGEKGANLSSNNNNSITVSF